jgi:hypothetical protein
MVDSDKKYHDQQLFRIKVQLALYKQQEAKQQ